MTIAIAYDDTEHGLSALHNAAFEAILRDKPLAVLHITPGVDKPPAINPTMRTKITSKLSDFPGLSWDIHSTPEGLDTAAAVVDLAESIGATMLVIGSRRRSAVGKLLLGSVVQQILMRARVPVLVVRQQ